MTAQKKYTITGFAKDAQSGETLIGATISITGNNRGITSNQYGFFSITLMPGNYTLTCSYAGYRPKAIPIALTANSQLNVELIPKAAMHEVIIQSIKPTGNIRNTQMGRFDLQMDQIKAIPAFLGEVDLIKTLQLLPGVRNAGEGSAGIYVRGGGPDQNLVLLDEAVVYNPGHLFGFFSVFNADAIKNVTLIKGGIPAQYGGRLSSVLDIAMKEGNDKKLQLEGGIGLIASRISLQGPIKKNKASFILSARRTYIDVLTKPFIKSTNNFYGSGYYFYDVNAKMNYRFSTKDRLYLSGYFGRDVFDFVNVKRSLDVNIPWGNATGTIRYNHIFNQRLFGNTSLVFNNYHFAFAAQQNDFNLKLSSGIRDYTLKQDIDFYPFTGHKIKFGGQYSFHKFTPSVVSGNQDTVQFKPQAAQAKFAHEAAVYIQDDWEVNDNWKVNAGLRYSGFQQIGPYTVFTTDANGNRTDSSKFKSGKAVKSYGGLEPRITLRYTINPSTSLKAAVTRNLQYIHLVSNAATTLPTDLWVPSTLKVKPQISWLYAVGLFKNFKNNQLETSVELYFKTMQNQIEYREGYTPNTLEDTEQFFTFGKGWSYGSEYFINKTRGRLTGWIGYTLSWTWRKFAGLNEGKKYPAKYDRRNDLSVVALYQLNKRWKLSGTFIYGTGNATTLPERFYLVNGVLTQEYSRINQYRLPPYHRIDFGATYSPKKNIDRKFKSEWVFSIYNVYNRKNPYFIYFDQTGSPYNGSLQVQAKQVSLFPIIPAITWNFKF